MAPSLTALLLPAPDKPDTDKDGAGMRVILGAPCVGLWRDAPAPGTLVTPGAAMGALEILGVLHPLRAPDGAYGIVERPDRARDTDAHLARRPVHYGQPILVLDPERVGAADMVAEVRSSAGEVGDGQLAFRASMGGRFYSRPSPDKPPFVAPGDTIEEGATVGLLEVMKTFNRITYGGDGLPARARVAAVVPDDESDISTGDIILLLEDPE